MKELHLIWSIRESSLFDLFANEVLLPLQLKTSGVFVHLFITGHKGFPVLSVEEILENMRRKKMTDDATQMKPDPHRSVLNADTFYGADELHFNSIKMKDCTSAPVYTSSPSLGITMHNMLEATIASHVTQMENEIGREDNSSSPSQTISLNPINVSIDQLLSGMLPISKFSVTFGRPDYGKMTAKLHSNFIHQNLFFSFVFNASHSFHSCIYIIMR